MSVVIREHLIPPGTDEVCSAVLDQLSVKLFQLHDKWISIDQFCTSVDTYHDELSAMLRSVSAAIRLDRVVRKPFGFFVRIHRTDITFTISRTSITYKPHF